MSMFARFNLKRAFAWLGLVGIIFFQGAPAALAAGDVVATGCDTSPFCGTYVDQGLDARGNHFAVLTGNHTIWYGSGTAGNGWVMAALMPDSVTVTDGLLPPPTEDWYFMETADNTNPLGTYAPRPGMPPTSFVNSPVVAEASAPAPEFRTWVQIITIGMGIGMMWKFMPKLKMGMSA